MLKRLDRDFGGECGSGERVSGALVRANIISLLLSELYILIQRGTWKKKPPRINNPKTQTMCTKKSDFSELMPPKVRFTVFQVCLKTIVRNSG